MLKYGMKEIQYLSKKDEVLNSLINRYGYLERGMDCNVFEALVFNIIGQQISQKAAITINSRLIAYINELTPINIVDLTYEELHSLGISQRKANYIRELAIGIMDGRYCLDKLEGLSDDEVVDYLTQIKGVGTWTAEMIAEFAMGRLNIFSFSDVALKNGIMKAHGFKTISETRFERLRRKYSPYCSVASLYYYALNDEQ